ncbi:putative G-patch domain-containing protein [Cryptosporidium canis]|nr:putative G-patch domain-containing protein [Cryptosporidium canis]
MEGSKFSFSIKKSPGKAGLEKRSVTVFTNYEDSQQATGDKVSKASSKGQTPGKRTQITSFSNTQSENERPSEDDQDEHIVIECKNSLKSSTATNSIQMLLNKRARSEEAGPDESDSSHGKNSFSIPVDQFGLAMLRGMGYDPQVHNTKPKIFKKRNYSQSGLGADKEIEDISKK